jgi:hypothetical protein
MYLPLLWYFTATEIIMTNSQQTLIEALRATAQRLRSGATYSWGHHGQCNCGNLAQVVTSFTEAEIQRYAITVNGEWTEMALEYCPTSNAPVDLIVEKLVELGLTHNDIHHIEYLSDKGVLKHLPGGFRWLKRNKREDAILYFEAFAAMLEQKQERRVLVLSS